MNINKLTQYQFIGIIIVVLLMGILLGHFIYPKEDKFSPDKNEWARLVIKNDIMDTTDVWETRYAINVSIFDEDKTIGVLITAANGEEPIDNPDIFYRMFKSRTESLIEDFGWLKDYQIILTIL